VQGKIVSSRYYKQVGLFAEDSEVGFPALIPNRKEEKIIFFFPCHFPNSLKGSCTKSQNVAQFFLVCLFFSLHVSGDYVQIIRRNNCIFAALGTCYSVWMTVWYAGCTKHTRNKHTKKNCAPRWLYLQDYTRMHGQQNIKLLKG
jgi:hypothetical protein